MKPVRRKSSARPAPARALAELRQRLAEAEATLHAIRSGEVDAVVVASKTGPQVFTLEGADHGYRMLIESMNEGALTLTADKMILYANQCFARMVKCPLEQISGSSFHRFLSAEDQVALRLLMKQATTSGSKIQVRLHAVDGSLIPALLSIRELANDGSKSVIIGMVVTDLTESRRTEELLRALTHRVVQAQEAERGRIALELHDYITQLLCAIVVRCQLLANQLPGRDCPAKHEAIKLSEMLGETADEVERISRGLRPGLLEHLGLVAVLRDTATEFSERTGVKIKLTCAELSERLPAETELALYRILQEALKNLELHACAQHVSVHLTTLGNVVQLTIKDDGIGFDPNHHPVRRKGKGGLGLLGMRERANYAGGVLTIKSTRRSGTEIEVRIPLPGGARS